MVAAVSTHMLTNTHRQAGACAHMRFTAHTQEAHVCAGAAARAAPSSPEHGSIQDVPDGSVGALPHLLQLELLHTGLIRSDGCTLDANVVLLWNKAECGQTTSNRCKIA